MSKIRRGWAADQEELGAAATPPELIRFPLYGAVATVLLAIVTIGPGSTCSSRTRSPRLSRCW